ncbi:hypothetical protein B0A52_04151 [Exophiala mesophila]|uniref:tRNA-dihydrouridine(16/17) synthase [NAD(P)(+)] n=1 Tax=Exophiala mesophila TaxID=212818 RepID=A0A438NAV1_EXOME|nr:hypothetical protein B0A52_04151 [Exophiala mesophila]
MHRSILSSFTNVPHFLTKRSVVKATMATMVEPAVNGLDVAPRVKLTGRAFYESIGSPKMIVAPMVDRSEFAWRLLTRSYLDENRSKSLLAYSPMLHARLFTSNPKFRDQHFKPTRLSLVSKDKSTSPPWLDGNPKLDRPLFVQFCANKPEELLDAAQYVAPYCDAVDLNLGCPQGIAKAGKYGAFLQEDWDTIYSMINTLKENLSVPVTAKMRILDTREKTLEYAKMILSAGASILTVHGRRREQKGHNTGVADWDMIRYLRDNLPPETVLFANGNILNSGDLEACLSATGVDGIMSAEGNLSDPTIFASPPVERNPQEYWYGTDGRSGYRIDGVIRRYLDINYKYGLDREPPNRPPLYTYSDNKPDFSPRLEEQDSEPQPKKVKRQHHQPPTPSIKYMQGHLFQLLRPMLSKHTDIRDALARVRVGDMDGFERILAMVEKVTMEGIDEYMESNKADTESHTLAKTSTPDTTEPPEMTATEKVIEQYKRPWWVCQPHIRPLPEDAIAKGALTVSKKDKAKAKLEGSITPPVEGAVQSDDPRTEGQPDSQSSKDEIPKAAMVCG